MARDWTRNRLGLKLLLAGMTGPLGIGLVLFIAGMVMTVAELVGSEGPKPQVTQESRR